MRPSLNEEFLTLPRVSARARCMSAAWAQVGITSVKGARQLRHRHGCHRPEVFRLDACPETREDFGAGILGTLGRDQQPSLDGYIPRKELNRSTVGPAPGEDTGGNWDRVRSPQSAKESKGSRHAASKRDADQADDGSELRWPPPALPPTMVKTAQPVHSSLTSSLTATEIESRAQATKRSRKF